MIYQIVMWGFLIVAISFMGLQFVRRKRGPILNYIFSSRQEFAPNSKRLKALGIASFMTLVFSGAFSALFGLIALMEWSGSSTVELSQYEKTIKDEVPEIKGSFTCQGTNLQFKGTLDTTFTHKGQQYQVEYPITEQFSEFYTYCPLDIKPPERIAINRFQDKIRPLATKIESTLSSGTLPARVKGEERKFLTLIMNTIEPVKRAAVAKIQVDASTNQVKVNVPSPAELAKVKVPAIKQNTDGAPTQLSTEEMLNNNISAQ